MRAVIFGKLCDAPNFPIVKFATVKHYTHVEYAQGAFIWIFNKAWMNKLPADLRETFIEVVHEVCQTLRKEARGQEAVMIKAA